jgi:glyoxylase-like metal-dependent hydrolase (beta-lactamase superfamily II)
MVESERSLSMPDRVLTACRFLVLSPLLLGLGSSPVGAGVVDVQRLSARVLVLNVPLFGRAHAVVVAGRAGLVLIDTGLSPTVARLLKEEVEGQLQRSDWAYVINTHAHGHHAGGNARFDGVPIIGHRNMLDEMETSWVSFMKDPEKRKEAAARHRRKAEELRARQATGDGAARDLQEQIELSEVLAVEMASGFEVVKPTLTFADRLTLDLGDLTLRAIFFGKGHSNSDVVVHIPEERVVVTGGVCYRFFPRIKGQVGLADLERSISVLDELLADPAGIEHVIPAHMELLGRRDLERLRDYYRDLLSGLRAARADRLDLPEAHARLALDQRFPYMSETEVRDKSREELHRENIGAVWRMLAQD